MGLRLSEAIRLGSMMHPQAFQRFRIYDHVGHIVATCAIGAASAAGFKGNIELGYQPCPSCKFDLSVGALITHLNDDHRWPREKIADWVEMVEAVQPITIPVSPETVPA